MTDTPSFPNIDSLQHQLGAPFRLDQSLSSFWAVEELLQALRVDETCMGLLPFVEQYVLATLHLGYAKLGIESKVAEGRLEVTNPAFSLDVRSDLSKLLRPPRPVPVAVNQHYDVHPMVGWAASPLYALGALLCAHPWGEGAAPVSQRTEFGRQLRELMVSEWLGETPVDGPPRKMVEVMAWPPLLLDLRYASRRLAKLEAMVEAAGASANELLLSLASSQSLEASVQAAAMLNRRRVDVVDATDARARWRASQLFGADGGPFDSNSFLTQEPIVRQMLQQAFVDFEGERYDAVEQSLLPLRDSAPDGRAVRTFLLLSHSRRFAMHEAPPSVREPVAVAKTANTLSTLTRIKHGPRKIPLPAPVEDDVIEELCSLGAGGMGQVHKVRHRVWAMELARKRPRPDQLGKAAVRQIEREAEAWSRLGLHPNVVSCYFVRRDDKGGLEIFAEYVSGGSLASWIEEGKLGQGSERLAHILRIAREVANGLDHAHRHGLIHQDVKPANVLMTHDGVAKVTDFGISGGRIQRDQAAPGDVESGKLAATCGGMTLAYCSPEQLAGCMGLGGRLGPATDIWSLAVLILEMLLGGVRWTVGANASKVLRAVQKNQRGSLAPIPQGVLNLLRACLAEDTSARPWSMSAVADGLRDEYERVTGRRPPPLPEALDWQAAGRNNRAVIMAELDRAPEAKSELQQALKEDSDNPHLHYNLALLRWRTGELDDRALVSILEHHPSAAPLLPMLARVHSERGDVEAAERTSLLARERFMGDADMLASIEDALGSLQPLHQIEAEWRCDQPVIDAALSQNGTRAVILSKDRLFVVTPAGQSVVALEHRGGRHVAIDRSGARVAVIGEDGMAVFDVASTACLASVSIPLSSESTTEGVTLSPDGRVVFYFRDRLLRVMEVDSGAHAYAPPTAAGRTTDVAVSPNDQLFAVSFDDTSVELQDYELLPAYVRTRWRKTYDHDQAVHKVAFAAGGYLLLSSCRGGDLPSRLVVRDLSETRVLTWPEPSEIIDIGVAAKGMLGVTLTKNGLLCVRRIESGQCYSTKVTDGEPVALSSSEQDTVLVATRGGEVQLLRMFLERPRALFAIVRPVDVHQAQQRRQLFQRAMTRARTALIEGELGSATAEVRKARNLEGFANAAEALLLWQEIGAKKGFGQVRGLVLEHELEAGPSTLLACNHDGNVVCWAGPTESARFVDMRQPSKPAEGWHRGPVTAVAVSSTGQLAATASVDGTVRIWRLPKGECATILRTGPGVSALLVNDVGDVVMLRQQQLERWSMGDTKASWTQEMRGATRAALAPQLSAVLCGDELVTLDETMTVRSSRSVPRVSCVAVSPDGGSFAFAGRDSCTLCGSDGTLVEFALEHPARQLSLASGAVLGVVVDELNQLLALERGCSGVPVGQARCAALSQDGSHVVLVGVDGLLRRMYVDRHLAD